MQFDFEPIPHRKQSFGRQSQGIEEMMNELDRHSNSDYNGGGDNGQPKNQFIDFDNFDNIEKSQSMTKSFTSELFNKPKHQKQPSNQRQQPSFPQSKNQPQVYDSNDDTSRDINQISYLYSANESFQFQRSMSFDQENQQCSRFQRLKGLLTKAKANNLDNFYKIINQNQQESKQKGNLEFNSKNQFKQYAYQMKVQKNQQEKVYEKTKILNEKNSYNKDIGFSSSPNEKKGKASLFGNEAAEAFKKKNQVDFNILPPQYTQNEDDDEENQAGQVDFFGSNNFRSNNHQKQSPTSNDNNSSNSGFDFQNNTSPRNQQNSRKQQFIQEGKQFFDSLNPQQYGVGGSSSRQPSSRPKNPLDPIREQKQTVLDHSMQQRKFKQLMNNYDNMKSNYNLLMNQLRETSTGQQKIMSEMLKMKSQYHKNRQEKFNNNNVNSAEDRKIKSQQKLQHKKIKQKQLQEIKQEIHDIKQSEQKDIAYIKINQKIQGLQRIVRTALQEVQEQKLKNSSFRPKIINYYDNDQKQRMQNDRYENEASQNNRNRDQNHSSANLSEQSSRLYEVQNKNKGAALSEENRYSHNKAASNYASNHNHPDRNSRTQEQRNSPSQNHYPITAKRDNYHSNKSSFTIGQNTLNNLKKQNLNFLDEFSSPLQLDLSVQANNYQDSGSQFDQQQINFCPPDFGLEYLPLNLDQTQTKNLRSILTQKSSILYESFQFLVTARFTMISDDQNYPLSVNLRISNKCAIDLLDVFVIVYGPHGQNVQMTPNKISQQRLKYNSNIFFQVRVDKACIEDNGFNIQVCYKTDSITKKKISFKALLPVIQMIRPQFCYEQNFIDSWDLFRNQIFITPRRLNTKQIRSHQDLKLILPLIDISEPDQNTFSYGVMFRYPKSKTVFMLKICCYINGKASIHLRSDKNGDQKLKQELLNVFAFLFLA